MIAQVAVAAVELQAAVDHVEAGIGRKPLGHGRKPRGGSLAPIERRRRPVEHQARRLELGCIVGDAKAERLEIREPSAELLPLLHMRDGALEAELRAAKRASRDVEAPAVEPAHGDLEPLPLAAAPLLHPSPSAPTRFATGTRHASKITIAVGCECQPSFFSCAPKLSPGVPFSTRKHEMPCGPPSPVRAITRYTSARPPPEMNALVPSRT